jgi:predicted helicase
MSFSGRAAARDKSSIVYDEHLTLRGIPEAAHAYSVGSRSALEWLLDRCCVRFDKSTNLTNNPNQWAAEHADPGYIATLIKQIVSVRVETVQIVVALTDLDFGAADH